MRTVPPLAAAFVLLVTPVSHAGAQTPPGDSWPVATPAEVGLTSAVLDSIDAEIRSGRYGYVDRFLVIRHGKLAYDRRYRHDYGRIYGDSARLATALRSHDRSGPYNYFNDWWHPFYRRGELHTLQSVTKTITSIIIGAAVTRGEFPSLDTPVLSFFDSGSVANIDSRKRRLTIRHLLTMTHGLAWSEDRPYGDTTNTAFQLESSYDWVDFAIDRPMALEPGERFNYSSGASQILAHVFARATGVDIEEYAAEHVFAPLGIRDWFWKRTPAGVPDTEGGLYLRSEDLAKLWQLWLLDGVWGGRRIVTPEWVRASVTPAVPVGDPKDGVAYGYKWWLLPNPLGERRHLWAGNGFGGQFPIAVPEHDLIIVLNAWNLLPGSPRAPIRNIVERILHAAAGARR
ncbi:MAG TPA: serine hydrolase [Gemmatimonadaceae bacterium]|nr:serine hydrolase [Gemmatimonadaceae bacterium]